MSQTHHGNETGLAKTSQCHMCKVLSSNLPRFSSSPKKQWAGLGSAMLISFMSLRFMTHHFARTSPS